MVMEKVAAVGSAAPAAAPADRGRYGGRRRVVFFSLFFSLHACSDEKNIYSIYFGPPHPWAFTSSPTASRLIPSSQPAPAVEHTHPTAPIIPHIDIPQTKIPRLRSPDRHTSSASDWHSWTQPSAGSFSLYSVPPPPPLLPPPYLVRYIIQQFWSPVSASPVPLVLLHPRLRPAQSHPPVYIIHTTSNTLGPDLEFRSSLGHIIQCQGPSPRPVLSLLRSAASPLSSLPSSTSAVLQPLF